MSSGPTIVHGVPLDHDSPVAGLAISERRVKNPLATIICVHGGLDRGGSFSRLSRRTELFDVVQYDRRGYQGSRELQPLTLEGHVDDLLAIAEREAQRGPVIYFGHSFGGLVTFNAAVRQPEFSQLVVNYESPLPWVLARSMKHAPLGDDPQMEAERFFRRMVSDSAWERLSAVERQSRRLDGPALVSDLQLLRSGATPFDLTELTTPSLYVHGDWGAAAYYRELCQMLASVNPLIASRELHDAGHGAHLANPDQLAALILEFWEELCV